MCNYYIQQCAVGFVYFANLITTLRSQYLWGTSTLHYTNWYMNMHIMWTWHDTVVHGALGFTPKFGHQVVSKVWCYFPNFSFLLFVLYALVVLLYYVASPQLLVIWWSTPAVKLQVAKNFRRGFVVLTCGCAYMYIPGLSWLLTIMSRAGSGTAPAWRRSTTLTPTVALVSRGGTPLSLAIMPSLKWPVSSRLEPSLRCCSLIWRHGIKTDETRGWYQLRYLKN